MKRTLLVLALALPVFAQSIDRTKPPETPPLAPFKLPPVHETKLPNGLTVVVVEDRRFPLVTFRLGFPAGSKFDPKELPGLSETVASLLKEGTKTRTSRQIAEELATIGASLSSTATADSMILSGNVLSDNTGRMLELLADVARNASFPEEEVSLRKQNRIQELMAERSQPSVLADEKLYEVVYGEHPYARFLPTPQAIEQIDRGALAAFRDRHLLPNTAVLILLGDVPARETLLAAVRSRFGDWERKSAPEQPAAKFPEPKRSIVLVDRPGSVQADVRAGKLAVPRMHPDYFPLLVGNSILGGGASSRMFMNIREKQGFAYDAHSELHRQKDAALFHAVTQIRNEVVEPALEAVFSEMSGMGEKPVPASELTAVKNYLNGVFVIGLETQAGIANELSNVRLMGLPDDYLETYVTRVRSTEPDKIQNAARKYISPGNATIVVVGDAGKIQKQVEKFGPVKVEKAQ
jgi:predicted Zn-dependent peptidase